MDEATNRSSQNGKDARTHIEPKSVSFFATAPLQLPLINDDGDVDSLVYRDGVYLNLYISIMYVYCMCAT